MRIVFDVTQTEQVEIRVFAYTALVEICEKYYDAMPDYMNFIFNVHKDYDSKPSWWISC